MQIHILYVQSDKNCIETVESQRNSSKQNILSSNDLFFSVKHFNQLHCNMFKILLF